MECCGLWTQVLDFVEKEAQELKSAERRFPDGKDCMGTFIVLPKMEDEEAELLYRFIYNRFHEQEIRGRRPQEDAGHGPFAACDVLWRVHVHRQSSPS
jgi:hypothetical protein